MQNPLTQLAAELKQQARALGFDLVGIAPADASRYADFYRNWLAAGQAGQMQYLHKRFDERTDVKTYFRGAQSVICVGMNYHVPLEESDESGARVARYALGDDYHELIKSKLHQLADWLRQRVPEAQTRAAVDTAPVMEKELAARAGVGWMGKNTCIINEQIGSWIFLGEVITTIPLPFDDPAIDRCGTCTRCIEACPTHAITAPYQLNASKCISYLTIEHRGEIADSLQSQLGDWLYGCDICQDVCPWNSKAIVSSEPGFQPRFETGRVDVAAVLSWKDEDYRQHFRGSAMKRVKLPVLQRNARIVAENERRGAEIQRSREEKKDGKR